MVSAYSDKSRQALLKPAVVKVRDALGDAGIASQITYLSDTARSAVEAAGALGVPVGAIVKTLVFRVGETGGGYPLICLVSGDKSCDLDALGRLLSMEGKIKRPQADYVKQATGYSIGGVSPAGLPDTARVVIDSSLRNYREIWAAAGHPHCVFRTSFEELIRLTNGLVSDKIGKG